MSAEDEQVASEIATVRARLYALGSTSEASAIEDRSFVLGGSGMSKLSFPFSFVIGKGEQARFLLLVTGYRVGESEAAIEQKVIASFQDKATVLVEIALARACLGRVALCSDLAQTCYSKSAADTAAGSCGPVPTAPAQRVKPGSELDEGVHLGTSTEMDAGDDGDAAPQGGGDEAETDANHDADARPLGDDAGAFQDAGALQDARGEVDGTSSEVAAIATSGSACSMASAKACDMHNGQQKLACFNGVWTPNGSCDGTTRCQTEATSPNVGTCQPIVSACVGKAPGAVVCDGSVRQNCGADLLDYVENPCAPHASCQSQGATVSCVCDAPYMDDGAGGCTVPICMQMPCQNAGICSLAAPGRTCDCSKVDYQGDSCESKIDNCSLSPCSNGGQCTDGLRTRTCNCSAVDYDGQSCETKRDDCTVNPCSNGGQCTDGLRTRSCSCQPGFSGSSCEINDNECAGTNVCAGSTNGVAYSFACVNYTGTTAGYTCQGQFPDWPVPTFVTGRFSYSLGVVTDNQTGLRWQQDASGTYTWANAKTHCTGLGGGWRLPTLAELLSIVHYGNNPSIDTSVFLATPENYFWTSSPNVGSSGYAWTVFFTDGSTAAINTSFLEYYVRCVR